MLTEHAEALAERGWIVDDIDRELVRTCRDEWESRFADPLVVNPDRFIWDYWYVPGQYALMRTTAERFFSPDTYDRLEQAMLKAANRVGCRAMSQPWISYYVSGMEQRLHTDAPHGPFAFVFSLTEDERRFTGGETMILKDSASASSGTPQDAKEMHDLFDTIPPRLGQLLCFDGRIPHGVVQVRGVQDPLHARVVVHGWYTEPTPHFEGDIDELVATEILNVVLEGLFGELQNLPPATGAVIAKLHIDADGSVTQIEVLSCTLRVDASVDRWGMIDEVLGLIDEAFGARGVFGEAVFEGGGGGGRGDRAIVLPLIF